MSLKAFAAALGMRTLSGMNAPTELNILHPPDRALGRYVSNELGPRPKKVVVRHLEACESCRKSVARLHALTRTYRDWERSGIMQVAQTAGR